MVFIDDVRIKNRKFSFKTDNADPNFNFMMSVLNCWQKQQKHNTISTRQHPLRLHTYRSLILIPLYEAGERSPVFDLYVVFVGVLTSLVGCADILPDWALRTYSYSSCGWDRQGALRGSTARKQGTVSAMAELNRGVSLSEFLLIIKCEC
jgi:hypothetical protein